jgi:hypothetical protein
VTGGPPCRILKARGDGGVDDSHALRPTPPLHVIAERGGCMAKLHARPSNQYRYEHYDPWFDSVG